MKKRRQFLRGKKTLQVRRKGIFFSQIGAFGNPPSFRSKEKKPIRPCSTDFGDHFLSPFLPIFFTRRGHKILHAPTAPLSTASFLRMYSRFFFFLFFRWFRHITEASNAYKSRESSRRAGARAPDAAAAAAAAGTANGGLSLDEPSASASKPAARSHSFNDAQGSSSSSAAAAAAGGGSAAASAAAAGEEEDPWASL